MKNEKITFKDAVNIGINLKYTVSAVFEKYDIPISRSSMHSLSMLNFLYKGEVSIKKLKDSILSHHPDISKSKLEVKLSKQIKILEDEGYIKKKKDKNDNRIITIKITEKGAKLIKEFHSHASKIWEEHCNV